MNVEVDKSFILYPYIKKYFETDKYLHLLYDGDFEVAILKELELGQNAELV